MPKSVGYCSVLPRPSTRRLRRATTKHMAFAPAAVTPNTSAVFGGLSVKPCECQDGATMIGHLNRVVRHLSSTPEAGSTQTLGSIGQRVTAAALQGDVAAASCISDTVQVLLNSGGIKPYAEYGCVLVATLPAFGVAATVPVRHLHLIGACRGTVAATCVCRTHTHTPLAPCLHRHSISNGLSGWWR